MEKDSDGGQPPMLGSGPKKLSPILNLFTLIPCLLQSNGGHLRIFLEDIIHKYLKLLKISDNEI